MATKNSTEMATEQPPTASRKSGFLRWMLLIVLLPCAAALTIWWDATRPGPLMSEKLVHFPKGTGFSAIIQQLGQEGVIHHELSAKLYAAAYGHARRFKAGEYRVPASASAAQIVEKLVKGDVVVRQVTLPEGLTVMEMLAIIAFTEGLEGDVPKDLPEGALLPETYHFSKGDTRAALVARMQQAMQKQLDDAWASRRTDLPITSKEQMHILASIVEKETGVAAERPQVAAVFINRLKRGMKLQSDPTVLYPIQQKNPGQTTIYASDLKRETPYNTYVIPGLPPTAIAAPGKASLQAVANPAITDDLYFVATGTGGHRFAKTLDEHNKNVREYRKILKEQSE